MIAKNEVRDLLKNVSDYILLKIKSDAWCSTVWMINGTLSEFYSSSKISDQPKSLILDNKKMSISTGLVDIESFINPSTEDEFHYNLVLTENDRERIHVALNIVDIIEDDVTLFISYEMIKSGIIIFGKEYVGIWQHQMKRK